MKIKVEEHIKKDEIVIHDSVWHPFNKPKKSLFGYHFHNRVRLLNNSSNRFYINRNYTVKLDCNINSVKTKRWVYAVSPKKEINSLELERKLYQTKKEKYLKDFEGKYIALQNEVILDSDSDFSKIAERVYAKYGYKPIFIPFVTKEERKLRLRSPRFK